MKKIRIRDIRHSQVSYLINLGCAPLLISERLDHEKVQTTLNTYSHLYPNKHQEVVDMIQNQHRLDEAGNLPDTPDNTESDNEPNATMFKVVSSEDIISPQRTRDMRCKKLNFLVNKGLSQYFE